MNLERRVRICLESNALSVEETAGDITVTVPAGRLVDSLMALKEHPDLKFDFLSDVIGIDNLDLFRKKKGKGKAAEEEPPEKKVKAPPPPRFEIVYLLLSLESSERLRVKIQVPENDMTVDSITSIWRAASWPEREIYDLFGINFLGHPDLKRLLMWDGFKGHPLRKDYPLEGKGETRRLVYEQEKIR